ncbi:MAG: hypothetical protein ACOVQ2_02375 [Flavobacterium sp.]
MKKITLVLTFIGMINFIGCTKTEIVERETIVERDLQDNDTYSEVFELRNVNFVLNNGVYEIYRALNPNILSSDQILIYRMSGTVNPTTPIWQLIPRTIYFPNSSNELDYDYDFSRVDFSITASGNFNIATRPEYLNNQTFRIVIVPGYFSGRLDISNFNDVMNFIGKTEADVKIMQ